MASSSTPPQAPGDPYGPPAVFGPPAADLLADEPRPEWNPSEESIRPVRGRHRVARQRSGVSRSGAVLGVGMMAAVGAGGIATAKDKPPAPVSVPDLDAMAADLSGVDGLMGGSGTTELASPLVQAGLGAAGTDAQAAEDAGEALRTRILRQADQQQSAAAVAAREAAARQAADAAAEDAAEKAAAAEAERKRRAAEEARRKAEAERRARLAASYTLPLSSFQLTSGYGQSGSLWSSSHTGQDFAAPTGTPLKAVHTGEIVEAGWAGSYGYRIVLQLDDGTEIWYCHLSSMTRTSGEVTTGDIIGRVGSTGNSSGAHLHLEVRPGGGGPVDPLAWLRGKGLGI